MVVQAAGNGGPSSSSLLSFRITTVAASITDHKYNNSIELGNGQHFIGTGLARSCQSSLQFVCSLVQGKLIICRYPFGLEFGSAGIATIADTIHNVGAAGFILTMNPYIASKQIQGGEVTLQVPGVS